MSGSRETLRWQALVFFLIVLVGGGCSVSPHAATIRVPTKMGRIAAGEGGVWILRSADEDPAVLRVDPRTNVVVATIPLPAIQPGADIAAGEGGVWITEGLRGQRVYRVDPKTNTVAATLSVGEEPWDIGVVAGAVWVGGKGAIHRINPAANAVTSIPFGGYSVVRLKVGADAVWAAFDYASEVSRIDPLTMSVSTVIALPADSFLRAVGEGSIWVIHGTSRSTRSSPEYLRGELSESVSAISLTSGRPVSEPITVGAFPHLIVGEGSLWLAFTIRGRGAFLVQRDPHTLRPIGSPLRLPSYGQFTTGFDSVWIVSSWKQSLVHRVPVCKRRWFPCSKPSLTGWSG